MASAPSNNSNSQNNIPPGIVELNVGGVFYSTSVNTLTSESGSKLSKLFGPEAKDEILKDSKVNICYMKFFSLLHWQRIWVGTLQMEEVCAQFKNVTTKRFKSYVWENICSFFRFSLCSNLLFPLIIDALFYVDLDIDLGIQKGKK